MLGAASVSRAPVGRAPTISILHATFRRPLGPIPVKETWLERAHDPDLVDYVLAMDADDPETVKLTDGHNRVVGSPGGGFVTSVRNWNAAASRARGDLLVVVADDLLPPPGWDVELRRIVGTLDPQEVKFAVKFSDSPFPNDVLLRHPVVSRAFYERFGLFSNQYRGVYCDNDITAKAFWHAVILDGRRLVMEHRHPTLESTERPSSSHTRVNDDVEYEFGKKVFVANWSNRQRLAPRYLVSTPVGVTCGRRVVAIRWRNIARSSIRYYVVRTRRAAVLLLHPRSLLSRVGPPRP